MSILSQKQQKQQEQQKQKVMNEILDDKIVTEETKKALIEYCEDKTQHSVLFVDFQELLIKVWNRIQRHKESEEIKKILNDEMSESICKCFTGRLTRLVNVLNGYYDDINIEIGDSEQLGNVVIAIRDTLMKTGKYTQEEHRKEVRKEFEEREVKENIIQEWLEFID